MLPPEIKQNIKETISLYSPEEKKKLAENPESLSPNPEVQNAVIEILSKDKNWEIRRSIAPKCPPEILTELAKDPSKEIRKFVAETPNCPPEAIKLLFQEFSLAAARQPQCPPEILTELSKNYNGSVRSAVARQPQCPVEVLEVLSKDPDWEVRQGVAFNPSSTPEILTHLSNDIISSEDIIPINPEHASPKTSSSWAYNVAEVRHAVPSNPKCPPELLPRLYKEGAGIWAFIKHPECPSDILAEIAETKDLKILQAIAKHPNRPPSLFPKGSWIEKSISEDLKVRQSTAADPACPQEILKTLSDDPEKYVRDTANSTLETLKQQAQAKLQESLKQYSDDLSDVAKYVEAYGEAYEKEAQKEVEQEVENPQPEKEPPAKKSKSLLKKFTETIFGPQ